MEQFLNTMNPDTMLTWLRAGFVFFGGLILARLLSTAIYRMTVGRMGLHASTTLKRVIFYVALAIVFMAALKELGFSLGVLLGAAGVLSVALGFASQTSASNLISGIFLVAESPFKIGDIIKVDKFTGEVLSIDLLSVKIRTFDNLFVRIPNETLIKAEITNLTRFPIRRVDIPISIAYKEDIDKARTVMIDVADALPICLDEPRPIVIFLGFGESSLDMQFSVWATRENYLELRNTIPERLRKAFLEAGIEIPFPHRSLYAGSETEPFPVRVFE